MSWASEDSPLVGRYEHAREPFPYAWRRVHPRPSHLSFGQVFLFSCLLERRSRRLREPHPARRPETKSLRLRVLRLSLLLMPSVLAQGRPLYSSVPASLARTFTSPKRRLLLKTYDHSWPSPANAKSQSTPALTGLRSRMTFS